MRAPQGRALAIGLAALIPLLAACSGGVRPPPSLDAGAGTGTVAASPSGPIGRSPSPPAEPTATAIRVQVRGTIRAEFAGYVAAIEEGYYETAGLDVTLIETPPGGDPVDAGSATTGPEFTIAWVPSVLAKRGKGTSDLVDIAQIFQRSGSLSLSWRADGITGPKKFGDRRVGVFGNDEGLEVIAGALRAGLQPEDDFTAITQRADLDGPLESDLDVAQTLIYDGYARVLESVNPHNGLYTSSDLNVIDWDDEGSAMLQDAVFARSRWLAQDGSAAIAEAFLKATFQGWIYCRDHGPECVEATIDAATRPVVSSGPASPAPAPAGGAAPSGASGAAPSVLPRPTFGPGHHTWALNEINALIWPAPNGIGVVDPGAWQHTVEVMLDAGFIPAAPVESAMRTDLARTALSTLADLDTSGPSFAKSPVEITPGGA